MMMNRVLGSNALRHHIEFDVIYRDYSGSSTVPWATSVFKVYSRKRGAPDRWAQAKWVLHASRFLRKNAHRYDVIHVHGTYLYNVLPALISGFPKPLVLLPVGENGDLRIGKSAISSRFKEWALRKVLAAPSVGMALSSSVAEEFRKLGMPTSRVCPLVNPAPDHLFETHPIRKPPTSNALRLGFVGKIGPLKGCHLVLDAIERLQSAGYAATALFVGPFESEEYGPQFWATAHELGIAQSIRVTGFVETVSAFLLDEMDIFVLPSSQEGMPGAMAEAMSAGLPGIVTDVGAMGDVIRASGAGTIVAPNGVSVAEAVKALVDEPEAWLEKSVSAVSYARKMFSPKHAAESYLAAVQLAISTKE
jgi:glycosyltransferase involved in cell wall biosynthesis